MDHRRSIGLLSVTRRLAAVAAFIALATVSWLTVRETLGVTLSGSADGAELAAMAVDLAPDYPFSHLTLGRMLDKTFMPEDAERSLAAFEKAVSLSPNDFRLWLELGRSYEKAGETSKAEAAFDMALERAPNYSRVQWTVGNFMIRQGRAQEAFDLIKKAADSEAELSPAAAAVAWDIFRGDLPRIEEVFGSSENLRGGLAAHLARIDRLEDSLRVWAAIPSERRSADLAPTGETIYRKIIESKRYLLAVRLDELAGREARLPGTVLNGAFEEEVRLAGDDAFGWRFGDGADIQIGIDTAQERNGRRERALAMLFGSDGRSFREVSQLVPVEPGGRYRFSVSYRADLSTSATVRWEVVNASDGRLLASTDAVADRSDWAEVSAEFDVPVGSEGVTIRLVRTGCVSAVCPISGKLWFDDVAIRRL